jgi:hypothetical protein
VAVTQLSTPCSEGSLKGIANPAGLNHALVYSGRRTHEREGAPPELRHNA